MDILFEIINDTGIITLNRPKALNALNLEMAELFATKLNQWKNSNKIKRILLQGEGKHFCAGGDVKSLVLSKNKNQIKKKFFKEEYKLNYLISKFPKDYLSIWNGVVMGGGVGLSFYGNYRLVNESSKFAMPETIIGFFPDVGASYFLSNLPKNFGKYLGLTGDFITANEMLYFNIATHYFDLKNLDSVKENFINYGKIETNRFEINKNSQLIQNLNLIDECFEGDIFSIINKLKDCKNEFSNKILSILNTRCPMSLMVTCELLHRAKNKSLKECLQTEFQLSQFIAYRDDFDNGVEAVLITKKNDQKWIPSSIDFINKEDINKLFDFNMKELDI